MSTATEISPPAQATAAAPSRLGPFDILGRLAGDGGSGMITLSVKGREGTAVAGMVGVAQCFAAPKDDEGRTRLTGILKNLAGLSHPALSSPIHADLSGNVAYVVNPASIAEISDVSTPVTPMRPSLVAKHLLTVSAALETAHRAGFSHGSLSRRTVTIDESGPVIGGWSLFGRGPAEDQFGLANLVTEWLAGSPVPAFAASDGVEPREGRIHRLRCHLEGLTEQLVLVLARASEPDAADRYASQTDFVAAFQEGVTRSAEDLVNGGFEALSSRSPQVAALMAVSAERYDAQAPGLDLLKLQLGGTSVPYASAIAPGGVADALSPAVGASSESPAIMAGLDPALTAGVPAEILALIAPPIPITTKPRNNPWMVMIVGTAGLTLLLMIGLAIAFFAGSK